MQLYTYIYIFDSQTRPCVLAFIASFTFEKCSFDWFGLTDMSGSEDQNPISTEDATQASKDETADRKKTELKFPDNELDALPSSVAQKMRVCLDKRVKVLEARATSVNGIGLEWLTRLRVLSKRASSFLIRNLCK